MFRSSPGPARNGRVPHRRSRSISAVRRLAPAATVELVEEVDESLPRRGRLVQGFEGEVQRFPVVGGEQQEPDGQGVDVPCEGCSARV